MFFSSAACDTTPLNDFGKRGGAGGAGGGKCVLNSLLAFPIQALTPLLFRERAPSSRHDLMTLFVVFPFSFPGVLKVEEMV